MVKLTVGEYAQVNVGGTAPTQRLTDEQQAIVDRVKRGDSLKVEALAGTGKTSTLIAVASACPDRRMLYIAFNRSVAEEGRRRFGANVEPRTAHSLAYASVGKHYGERIQRNLFALKRGLMPVFTPVQQRAKKMSSGLVVAALETIRNFEMTADPQIVERHVREGVPDPTFVVEMSRAAWTAMADRTGSAPITDSTYLKLWQLTQPKLRRDAILFDEAQDADPVMLDIVARAECQKVYVGDEHQQIYEWRGAENALRKIGLPSLPLTQSWRFGPLIADYANRVLTAKRATLRVRGRPDGQDEVCIEHTDCPDVVLSRTNVGLVGEALSLADDGKTIAVVGGLAQLVKQIEAAYELFRTGRTGHPAFAVFDSWQELVEASETEQGQSYRPFVQLVHTRRAEIPDICRRLYAAERTEGEADVLLCTIHRFKGREGSHVRLSGDLRPFVTEERDGSYKFDEPEANLDYVAITRARSVLNLSSFAWAFAESCRLAPLVVWPEAAPDVELSPVVVPAKTAALPLDTPLSSAEEEMSALELRLRKGEKWLDKEHEWLTRHRHEPLTAEYAERHQAYERQQARWTAMLTSLSDLYARCPHTQRELVRLVGEDRTSYPYERCATCRNNVDGPGVYLDIDDPRLMGVRIETLPKSSDYLTPPEAARLEAANATGRLVEKEAVA